MIILSVIAGFLLVLTGLSIGMSLHYLIVGRFLATSFWSIIALVLSSAFVYCLVAIVIVVVSALTQTSSPGFNI